MEIVVKPPSPRNGCPIYLFCLHRVDNTKKITQQMGAMISEYLKALGERDVHNLRMLLNEVLSGGCIPNEWKESRVVLVHKGGSKKE